MNNHFGSADPPHTLAERLTRLNDNLQSLGERLKASIASVLGDAIADAVRDSVRSLLGGKDTPADPYRLQHDDHAPGRYADRADDPWGESDPSWEEEIVPHPHQAPATGHGVGKRCRNALSSAVQAALWFLKQQPRRRPILTTLAVTLAAGVTGFLAGPAIAAGAGVLVSIAGLMFTADASQSAAQLAAG